MARERSLPLEPVELDVCDDASVDRCVSGIERIAGPIDILINNAGIMIFSAMEDISIQDLQKLYETNVFGALRVTKRVLPEMRRRFRGRIINMSSLSGRVAHPLFGPYSSTKYALESISDVMRLELYPFAVDVVLIEPGYIPTSIKQTGEELSSVYLGEAENSPYAKIYQRHKSSWGQASDNTRYKPEDCARVVLRAIETARPGARYPLTRAAWVQIFAKWLLPDQVFDRYLRKIFGLDEFRKPKQGKRTDENSQPTAHSKRVRT
jgi:NAD(P)-dependent dehydrogenase (short-subunit alcohol dehydrogenase family)